MDKQSLLEEIYDRNAIRLKAQLPPLDVRVEYEQAVRQVEHREYEFQLKVVSDEFRHRLFQKNMMRERRKKNDPTYRPWGSLTYMRIGMHFRKVEQRILRMRTGLIEPFYETASTVKYNQAGKSYYGDGKTAAEFWNQYEGAVESSLPLAQILPFPVSK